MTEIEILRAANITLEQGLTETEYRIIENIFNIQFPPDLKRLLSIALPVSKGFPNWRNAIIKTTEDFVEIEQRLNWPLEGILFDIEENNVWYEPWGHKPDNIQERKEIVRSKFPSYPTLVPVYGHRYIPTIPMSEGNPIFSVWQTDIIYYGVDLHHYLKNEFEIITTPIQEPKKIDFWYHWANDSACW